MYQILIWDFYGEFMDVSILAGIKEDLLEFAYDTLITKGVY